MHKTWEIWIGELNGSLLNPNLIDLDLNLPKDFCCCCCCWFTGQVEPPHGPLQSQGWVQRVGRRPKHRLLAQTRELESASLSGTPLSREFCSDNFLKL